MNTLRKSVTVMVLVFALLLSGSALYADGLGVKVGTLKITAIPGTGRNLIINSSSDLEAVFTGTSGKKEYYIGEMGIKLGIDLSIKKSQELLYAVFAPSSKYRTGSYALQGKYFGQKASAAVGAGPTVQILIGGFEKSFSLQPLAIGGTTGVGVEAGMGYMYLQKDPNR